MSSIIPRATIIHEDDTKIDGDIEDDTKIDGDIEEIKIKYLKYLQDDDEKKLFIDELKEPIPYNFQGYIRKDRNFYMHPNFKQSGEGVLNQKVINLLLRQVSPGQAKYLMRLIPHIRKGLTINMRSGGPSDVVEFCKNDPITQDLGSGSSGHVVSKISHGKMLIVKRYHDLVTALIIIANYFLLREGIDKQEYNFQDYKSLDIPLKYVELDPISFYISNDCVYSIKDFIEGDGVKDDPVDMKCVEELLNFLHINGFCHLDVSFRNLIVNNSKAFLIDYDTMTPIGTSCLLPLPRDVSTQRAMKRYLIANSDDQKGWRIVKGFDSREKQSCEIL